MQSAERVLIEVDEGERQHVHSIMDRVVDGRENGRRATIGTATADAPERLVHCDASARCTSTCNPVGEAVEASCLYGRARCCGRTVRAVPVVVPGRERVCLEYFIGNSVAIKPCADDLAAAVVDAPVWPNLALSFPP
jgi:hypothetical protein